MTPLTPENARPGVRVVCVKGGFFTEEARTYTVLDWSIRMPGKIRMVETGEDYSFHPECFVLAEPEQSLSAVLSSRADGAALLEAIREWHKEHRHYFAGTPAEADLFAVITDAGLAPPPPQPDAAAPFDAWWWV